MYDALMQQALDLAVNAAESDDVPVGAIVVDASGTVIGKGHNTREREGDPTRHAEIVVARSW